MSVQNLEKLKRPCSCKFGHVYGTFSICILIHSHVCSCSFFFLSRNGDNQTQISGWYDAVKDSVYIYGATAPSVDYLTTSPKAPDIGQCGIWALSGLAATASSIVSVGKIPKKKMTWRNFLFRPSHETAKHMGGTMPFPTSESSCCFDPVTRKAYVYGGWNHDVYTMGVSKRGQMNLNTGKYYGTLHEIDMDVQMIRCVENNGEAPTATVLGPGRRGYVTLGVWTPVEDEKDTSKDRKNTVLMCGFGYSSWDADQGNFGGLQGKRDVWTCEIEKEHTNVKGSSRDGVYVNVDTSTPDESELVRLFPSADAVVSAATNATTAATSLEKKQGQLRRIALKKLNKRILETNGSITGISKFNVSTIAHEYQQAFTSQRGAIHKLVHRKCVTLLAPPSRGRGAFVLNVVQEMDDMSIDELNRAKVDGAVRLSNSDFWSHKNVSQKWLNEKELFARFPNWMEWSPQEAKMYANEYNAEEQVFIIYVMQERQQVLDQYKSMSLPAGTNLAQVIKQIQTQIPNPAVLSGAFYGRWNPNVQNMVVFSQNALNQGKCVLSGQTETEIERNKTSPTTREEKHLRIEQAREARAMCCSNKTCPNLEAQRNDALAIVLRDSGELGLTTPLFLGASAVSSGNSLSKMKKCVG